MESAEAQLSWVAVGAMRVGAMRVRGAQAFAELDIEKPAGAAAAGVGPPAPEK